jgi:nucleoside phosphorylase
MASLTPDDYTIAWICALPLEAAAARVMLDKIHNPLPQPSTDPNAYILGELNGRFIVVACLPTGVYGTVSAATVVSYMRSTFTRVEFGLSVGIGGGVPGRFNDIRLGDVVVGTPGTSHSGVIQYDYGKAVEPTRTLPRPPETLLASISSLRARHEAEGDEVVSRIVERVLEQNPRWRDAFSPPKEHADFLFDSSYRHGDNEDTCEESDKEQLVKRPQRYTRTPSIHYGLIASGNQMMKDSEKRDYLAQQYGILCFEMEAAGLMDELPILVIRGISDYCDSHKNKEWQGYAALTAAAYTKSLLSVMPVYGNNYPLMQPMWRAAVDSTAEFRRTMGKDSPRKDNMGDTLMAKYSHDSSKGADPTREVPTEDYPPSMAAITTTESSALSRGFGSSGDALETVNASTAGTSMDPGGQEMNRDSADDESIYTSDVPRSLAYVQELASSFFRGSDIPDAKSLERIRDGLPDLLRGFAQRIGGENHSSVQFEVMKFICKRRM